MPREDIAASVLHAVVLQILATLARGYDPAPLILFSGGPLTFIPALRAAFLDVLGLGESDLLEATNTELLPAIGAALAQKGEQGTVRLSRLIEQLHTEGVSDPLDKRRLQPLFDDPIQHRRWEASRDQHRIEQVDVHASEGQTCFLGVDSGSTTSKMVLIDDQGQVAFKYYSNNKDNAIQAVQEGLKHNYIHPHSND